MSNLATIKKRKQKKNCKQNARQDYCRYQRKFAREVFQQFKQRQKIPRWPRKKIRSWIGLWTKLGRRTMQNHHQHHEDRQNRNRIHQQLLWIKHFDCVIVAGVVRTGRASASKQIDMTNNKKRNHQRQQKSVNCKESG